MTEALRVNQMSRATLAQLHGPAGSTSSHRPLGPWSEVLRILPSLPGVSRLGPIARGGK